MFFNIDELLVLLASRDANSVLTELKKLDTISALEVQGKNRTALHVAFETANSSGKTLLHAMIEQSPVAIELLEWVLQHGAPVNQLDEAGQSLLHKILQSTNHVQLETVVKILLRWDIDLFLKSKEGLTALALTESLLQEAEEGSPNLYQKLAARLRVQQESQSELQGLRLNYVLGLCHAILPKIAMAKNHDKLLLIGCTGFGKSTLLNYLNGTHYDLLLEEGTGRLYAQPRLDGVVEIAPVGCSTSSETLYPTITYNKNINCVYCDLPGLEDNRGSEERVCAANGVRLLSQLPGKIKGLLVLLTLDGFARNNNAFIRTALALAKMVKMNPELMQAVGFVITQVRVDAFAVVTAEGIVKKIQTLIPFYQRKKQAGIATQDDEALLFVFEKMLQLGARRIKIVNISDAGESRREIENMIQEFQAQDASQFDFMTHDGAQTSFKQSMVTLCKKFLFKRNRCYLEIPQSLAEHQDVHENLIKQEHELIEQIAKRKLEIPIPTAVLKGSAQLTQPWAEISEKIYKFIVRRSERRILKTAEFSHRVVAVCPTHRDVYSGRFRAHLGDAAQIQRLEVALNFLEMRENSIKQQIVEAIADEDLFLQLMASCDDASCRIADREDPSKLIFDDIARTPDIIDLLGTLANTIATLMQLWIETVALQLELEVSEELNKTLYDLCYFLNLSSCDEDISQFCDEFSKKYLPRSACMPLQSIPNFLSFSSRPRIATDIQDDQLGDAHSGHYRP